MKVKKAVLKLLGWCPGAEAASTFLPKKEPSSRQPIDPSEEQVIMIDEVGQTRGYSDYLQLKDYVERDVKGFVLSIEISAAHLALVAAKKPEVSHVVAVLMNPEALTDFKNRATAQGISGKIEFREGNLFEPVEERGFDYIIFNPPEFTPDLKAPWFMGTTRGTLESPSMFGGGANFWVREFYRRSEELIRRFLMEANHYLSPEGRILFKLDIKRAFYPFGTITVKKIAKDYAVEILEDTDLGFERIFILSLKLKT